MTPKSLPQRQRSVEKNRENRIFVYFPSCRECQPLTVNPWIVNWPVQRGLEWPKRWRRRPRRGQAVRWTRGLALPGDEACVSCQRPLGYPSPHTVAVSKLTFCIVPWKETVRIETTFVYNSTVSLSLPPPSLSLSSSLCVSPSRCWSGNRCHAMFCVPRGAPPEKTFRGLQRRTPTEDWSWRDTRTATGAKG